MRGGPRSKLRGAAEDLLDGRLDPRLVEVAVDVEVEEGIDVLEWHLPLIFARARCRAALEAQLGPIAAPRMRDAVGGQQRLGAAQDVVLPSCPSARSALAATSPMSWGSITATPTFANGSRTTSPSRKWSRQRSAWT